jgi:transmembrane sensor
MSVGADSERIEAEASAWFAALNQHKVDVETLQEFQVWRRDPTHDAAYERVQKIWKEMGAVRDDPAVAAALRNAKARIAKARAKEGLPLPLPAFAGLAVVLVASVLAGTLLLRPGPQRYETAVGEQRRVTLADGSTVKLDTRSSIEVRYTRQERLVRLLSGQALFEVAHRADQPFHVQADGLDVRDLGTAFTVRRDGDHALVTVVSGEVQVKAAGRPQRWTLSAGLQLDSAAPQPRPVDVARFTRWTSGRVEFNDITLAAAAEEMNRYAVHPIVLQGDKVGRLRVSGAFNATDMAGFAKALTDAYGLVVTRRADGSLVVAAPNPPPSA